MLRFTCWAQLSFKVGTPVPESGPRDHPVPARTWDLSIMTSVF